MLFMQSKMPYAFNVYLIVPELVPSYEGCKSMGMSSESKQVHWGGKAVDHAINVSMNLWLVWWDVDITRPKKINSSRILGPMKQKKDKIKECIL